MDNVFYNFLAVHPNLSSKYLKTINTFFMADGGDLSKVQNSANNVMTNVINLLTGISMLLAALMYAWGGILYQTGSQDNIRKAKTRWFTATIGLIVVVGALTLAKFAYGQANTFK